MKKKEEASSNDIIIDLEANEVSDNDRMSKFKTAGKVAASVVAAPVVATAVVGKAAYMASKKVSETIAYKYQDHLKNKFNPISLDMLNDSEFRKPKIVRIVDDFELSKKYKINNDSIGGLVNVGKMPVLYLFDKDVNDSGLKLIPEVQFDSVYLWDPYRNNTFIQAESYYAEILKQRLAELSNIAFCIGAKSYRVELCESEENTEKLSQKGSIKANAKVAKAGVSESYEESVKSSRENRALASATFTERRNPEMPILRYYRHDIAIHDVINQALNDRGTLTVKDVELVGSSHKFMSKQTAASIDATIKKIGASIGTSVSKQTTQEITKKMIFHLEF